MLTAVDQYNPVAVEPYISDLAQYLPPAQVDPITKELAQFDFKAAKTEITRLAFALKLELEADNE